MFKSKPEFKHAPQVEKYYDISDTFGVASHKKELGDMKLRVEEAENKAKNIRLRNDLVEHQKKALYQGQLDDVNRQLERPMMPVRTKEELEKRQSDQKNVIANII